MAIKASLLPGPVNSFLTLIALLISLAHCTAGELPSERNPLPWCNSTLLPGTPLGRDNAQGLLASSWILSDNVTLTALQQECWEKPLETDDPLISYAKLIVSECLSDLGPDVPTPHSSIGLTEFLPGYNAACNAGAPCRELHDMILNGTYTLVADQCGGVEAYSRVLQDPQALITMALTQKCWDANGNECWGTLSTGENVGCPVFDWCYRGNIIFSYFLGGIDAVSRMPACRVEWGTPAEEVEERG